MPTLIFSQNVNSAASDTSTLTTSSFTPPQGAVIVVKGATEDSAIALAAPTDTQGNVYTSRVSDATASHVWAGLWTAVARASTAMTVSITIGTARFHSMTVEVWSKATLAASPAVNGTKIGTGTTATSTITTTAAGSVVSWLDGDWSATSPAGRTYNTTSATPTEDGLHDVSPGSYVSYFAYQTAVSPGSQTFGIATPTPQTWTLLAVEILDGADRRAYVPDPWLRWRRPWLQFASTYELLASRTYRRLTFDFEAGTLGNTVAPADPPSAQDTAFNAVVSAGATFAYDNTQVAHGLNALKVQAAATASYSQWNVTGIGTTVFFRFYMYIPSAASFSGVWDMLQGKDASTRWRVRYTVAGKLSLLNTAGTAVATTTASLPLDAWVRVEGKVFTDPVNGTMDLRFYSGDSTTPTESIGAVAVVLGTGEITQTRWGNPFNSVTSLGPVYFDDFGLATDTYLGPAGTTLIASAPVLVPSAPRTAGRRVPWERRSVQVSPVPPQATAPAAPAYPVAATRPRRLFVGSRRSRAASPVSAQASAPAAPTYAQDPGRHALHGLLTRRLRVAVVPAPQVEVQAPRRARRVIVQRRRTSAPAVVPAQALPAPTAGRRRSWWSLRSRPSAPTPPPAVAVPAAPQYPFTALRSRRVLTGLRRGKIVTPVPPQATAPAVPQYPVTAQRPRRVMTGARRSTTPMPVPAQQGAAAPPPYPAWVFRVHRTATGLRRGKIVAPVPPQVSAPAAPQYPVTAQRPRRVMTGARRATTPMPVPAQATAPAAPAYVAQLRAARRVLTALPRRRGATPVLTVESVPRVLGRRSAFLPRRIVRRAPVPVPTQTVAPAYPRPPLRRRVLAVLLRRPGRSRSVPGSVSGVAPPSDGLMYGATYAAPQMAAASAAAAAMRAGQSGVPGMVGAAGPTAEMIGVATDDATMTGG